MLAALACAPGAPALLARISHRPPRALHDSRLRQQRLRARMLQGCEAMVVLAAADRARVHACSDLTFAMLGYSEVGVKVRPAREVAGVLADRLRVGRSHGRVPVEATVLLAWVDGDVPAAVVTVPGDADGARLADLGRALAAACDELAEPVTVVAPGDLAAAHGPDAPRPTVGGAEAFDHAAVAAVAAVDPAALADLGPSEAGRLGARGWAPMVTLLAAADQVGADLGEPAWEAPCGVGYLRALGRRG